MYINYRSETLIPMQNNKILKKGKSYELFF
nr:MAG TPA: hypothetical protein [Caudoviricetes sp.]